MRTAYLILAHKDPAFIDRVADRLTNNTEDHVFIHVDLKTHDFDELMNHEQRGIVHWIKKRFNVYWGGYSVIEAELELFRESCAIGFDRYMVMHGADYPLFSPKSIGSFFEDNSSVEFIKAMDETEGDHSEWFRFIPKYYLDKPNAIKRIINKASVSYWKSNLPKPKRNCMITVDGKKYHFYRGWGHFAITHDCVEYVLSFSKAHKQFNDIFRHVYVPDESYFHTIIFNSAFAKNTVYGGPNPETHRSINYLLNLTYFEYPSSVREFKSESEYEYLLSKGFPFFRKASSGSIELLDRIDSENRYYRPDGE